MAPVRLMNKVDIAEYLGRFNQGYVKEFPNGSDVECAIYPHLIAIMKENFFAADDPDEDPYNHLHFFIELCWTTELRNCSDDELKV
jgi:hypothetical protein